MELIIVHYKCKPHQREAFLNEILKQELHFKSQQEAGNILYELACSVDNEDDVILLEKWQDLNAQKAHGSTAHYAALSELKKMYVLDTSIEAVHI